jgi:hypothetical protein
MRVDTLYARARAGVAAADTGMQLPAPEEKKK